MKTVFLISSDVTICFSAFFIQSVIYSGYDFFLQLLTNKAKIEQPPIMATVPINQLLIFVIFNKLIY